MTADAADASRLDEGHGVADAGARAPAHLQARGRTFDADRRRTAARLGQAPRVATRHAPYSDAAALITLAAICSHEP